MLVRGRRQLKHGREAVNEPVHVLALNLQRKLRCWDSGSLSIESLSSSASLSLMSCSERVSSAARRSTKLVLARLPKRMRLIDSSPSYELDA